MKLHLKIACLLLFLAGHHLAHADSFLYSVVYDDGSASVSTSFVEPAILTQNTEIESSDLLNSSWSYNGASGNELVYLFLSPSFNPSQPTSEPLITILLPVGQYVTMAFNNDLTSVGTYPQAFFDDGSLMISEISNPIPEPSTLTFMGIGALAAIAFLHFRFRKAADAS